MRLSESSVELAGEDAAEVNNPAMSSKALAGGGVVSGLVTIGSELEATVGALSPPVAAPIADSVVRAPPAVSLADAAGRGAAAGVDGTSVSSELRIPAISSLRGSDSSTRRYQARAVS